jgi:hypothetical protein
MKIEGGCRELLLWRKACRSRLVAERIAMFQSSCSVKLRHDQICMAAAEYGSCMIANETANASGVCDNSTVAVSGQQ